MPVKSLPSVSVVVPVYNGGTAFGLCLDGLRSLNPQPHEIIVIGDGDTDGSSEAARKAGVNVLRIPSRRGQSHARNLGAEKSSGDILLFMDADVLAPNGVVGRIAETFCRNPELSAVIGSYDDEPWEPDFFSQYRNLLHHYVHQNGKEKASTFWTGCGAIRRDVFFALGGFSSDESIPRMEDIELGYRLIRHNHFIFLDKGLLVKHLKKWSALSILKTDFFYRALPWTRLILREGAFVDDLNIRISSRWCVICVFTFAICAALCPIWSIFLYPAMVCAVLLCLFNRDLYRFFLDRYGVIFLVKALFWHWLYFFYSGLAFAWGLCEFGLMALRGRLKKLRYTYKV